MNQVIIRILNQDGTVKLEQAGQNHSELVWYGSYEPGDRIEVQLKAGCFARIQADTLIAPALIYTADGTFRFEVPFGRAKEAYPQEAFTGPVHQLTAEYVDKPAGRRYLSENPLDVRGETAVYPHCTASIETRGESVFAARNTIDGLLLTSGHGFWPYTSWGEGEDPDAEIVIWFGRDVLVDGVQVFLRSDFPHDNYWKEALLTFSDGYELPIRLEKTGGCQSFSLDQEHEVTWVKMRKFKKDENDPSPFPALTQWRVCGREK